MRLGWVFTFLIKSHVVQYFKRQILLTVPCMWKTLPSEKATETKHKILSSPKPWAPQRRRPVWQSHDKHPVTLINRTAGCWIQNSRRRKIGCISKNKTSPICSLFSQLRWFSNYLWCLLLEVFWKQPTIRRPQGRPRTCGGILSPSWPGNASGSHRMSWEILQVRGKWTVLLYFMLSFTHSNTDDRSYHTVSPARQ